MIAVTLMTDSYCGWFFFLLLTPSVQCVYFYTKSLFHCHTATFVMQLRVVRVTAGDKGVLVSASYHSTFPSDAVEKGSILFLCKSKFYATFRWSAKCWLNVWQTDRHIFGLKFSAVGVL